jgi:hypothetical protein
LANLPAQIFYLEWMDFGEASLRTDLVPKNSAYTAERIRDLIKLDTLDKKITVPMYRVMMEKTANMVYGVKDIFVFTYYLCHL